MKKILCMAMCAMMCSGSFAMNMFTRQLPPGALEDYAGVVATGSYVGADEFFISERDKIIAIRKEKKLLDLLPHRPGMQYGEGETFGVAIHKSLGIIKWGSPKEVEQQVASVLSQAWNERWGWNAKTRLEINDGNTKNKGTILDWYVSLTDEEIKGMMTVLGGLAYIYKKQ